MAHGKLIVLYGINNLGKSTQAMLLVERLRSIGKDAAYLKYPLYDLEPSGPMLNEYLRKGNPSGLSSREAQILYSLNRTQYDTKLRLRIAGGEWIVAEDYVGTGIAWGMGRGVEQHFLERISQHLLREDCGLFFTGRRFLEAREAGHLHEQDDDIMDRVAIAHQKLAVQYGWHEIGANGTIEEVQGAVWQVISSRFGL